MNTIIFCRIFSLILGIITATLIKIQSFQHKTKVIPLNQFKSKDRFSPVEIEKHLHQTALLLSAV